MLPLDPEVERRICIALMHCHFIQHGRKCLRVLFCTDGWEGTHQARGMECLDLVPLLLRRFWVANKCIATSSHDHVVLTLLTGIFDEPDKVIDESSKGLARVAASSATGAALDGFPFSFLMILMCAVAVSTVSQCKGTSPVFGPPIRRSIAVVRAEPVHHLAKHYVLVRRVENRRAA